MKRLVGGRSHDEMTVDGTLSGFWPRIMYASINAIYLNPTAAVLWDQLSIHT
jgi:hypothetical protein